MKTKLTDDERKERKAERGRRYRQKIKKESLTYSHERKKQIKEKALQKSRRYYEKNKIKIALNKKMLSDEKKSRANALQTKRRRLKGVKEKPEKWTSEKKIQYTKDYYQKNKDILIKKNHENTRRYRQRIREEKEFAITLQVMTTVEQIQAM